MAEEMLSFFPNGIRALLVDADSNFLKSATMMFSPLQYKVATCGSPTSAMRLLSGGKVKDVDVVLADAHQVSACGFDLSNIVENCFNIPVLYFMSSESPFAAGDAQSSIRLARVVQAANYIIKKPLDGGELRNLWRTVAWRRCVLEDARKTKDCINLLDSINNVATDGVVRANSGGGRRRTSDDINGGEGSSGSLKKKFEHALKYVVGTGGHPSETILDSYLQNNRTKLQKTNDRSGGVLSPCSYENSTRESQVIRSFLPTLIPQISPGSARPSNVDVSEGFTGENYATALPLSWTWHPPLFRQPSGNSIIADTRAPVMLPTTHEQQPSSIIEAHNGVAMAFAGGSDAPVAPSYWFPSFQNPACRDDVSSSRAVAVAMQAAEEQPSFDATAFTGNAAPALPPWDAMPTEHVSDVIALEPAAMHSGAAMDAIDQQMFVGPFSYQDPFPSLAAPNTLNVQCEVEQQQQQVVVATAAADEEATAAADEEAAAMVAEMVAAPNGINGPAVASYELGAMATAANESFTLAQLDAFLQQDTPAEIDGGSGSRRLTNGNEDGTQGWSVGTHQGTIFLEDILRDNTEFDDTTDQ